MTQSAASGSPGLSTDPRNVVGNVDTGFDGPNLTIALPSSQIFAALFEILEVDISVSPIA
jgi:hypothetical protein